MNNMTVKDIFDVFVCKSIASGNTATDTTLLDAYDVLTDGEVAIVDSANKVVNAEGSGDLDNEAIIRIAQRIGERIRYSDTIKVDNITSMNAQAYAAATQQLDYIGYNGTSGAIEEINSNDYDLTVNFKTHPAGDSTQAMFKGAFYTSGESADGGKIAIGLVGDLLGHLKYDPEKRMQPSVICSGAVTTANSFVDDVVVVKGLNTLTITQSTSTNEDAGSYNTDVMLVPGDYIRISGTNATTTTTLGDNVYRVEKVEGTSATVTITLDRPVLEASGTYDGGSNESILVITATIAGSADFGIKLQGIARKNVNPKNTDYYNFRWTLSLSGFGTTSVTNTTAASEGTGTPAEAKEMEYTAQFLRGNYENHQNASWENDITVDDSATYNVAVIDFYETSNPALVSGKNQPKQVFLFLHTGDDNGDEVMATLNTHTDFTVSV